MESGKFIRERIGEYLPALYSVMGHKRGAVAYFISNIIMVGKMLMTHIPEIGICINLSSNLATLND